MGTSVFIVDDHPIFREGLRSVIQREPTLELAGEAGDGAEALTTIRDAAPDVVTVDIEIPGQDGLDLARELRRLRPTPAVIVLTMHREESLVNAALDAGVAGYVLKDNATAEIVSALRVVGSGEVYLSPSISGVLVRRHQRREATANRFPALTQLTAMERRVLKLTAEGMSCREIAAELFISHRTVETHRHNAARKLDLRGTNRLLQFAIEHRSEL
jgi:DNA-binding NarL/FixJ family response regulator